MTTLAGGLVSACIGGVALASDPVAAGDLTTPPVVSGTPSVSTITDSQVILTGANNGNVVSDQHVTATVGGPSDIPPIDPSAQAPVVQPIGGVTPPASSVIGTTTPVSTNQQPVASVPSTISASVLATAMPSSPSTPAARAERQHYYRTVIQRTTETQGPDGSPALPNTSPIVNDSSSNTSSGTQNNGPLPTKTSGLLGAFTLALDGVVMPNNISNLFKIASDSTTRSLRILGLLIMITTFIQGFIMYVRRAGFIRAPRAGLSSHLTFATSPLMSHFVPI